jgi:hypothetical protein
MIEFDMVNDEWFDGGEYIPPKAGDYHVKVNGKIFIAYFDGMLFLKTKDQQFNEVLEVDEWSYI